VAQFGVVHAWTSVYCIRVYTDAIIQNVNGSCYTSTCVGVATGGDRRDGGTVGELWCWCRAAAHASTVQVCGWMQLVWHHGHGSWSPCVWQKHINNFIHQTSGRNSIDWVSTSRSKPVTWLQQPCHNNKTRISAIADREVARCFVSLIFSLIHWRSLEMTPLSTACVLCKSLLVFSCNYVSISCCFWDSQRQIMACPWNLG